MLIRLGGAAPCKVAHVDHGKTSLTDGLVASNRIISNKQVVPLTVRTALNRQTNLPVHCTLHMSSLQSDPQCCFRQVARLRYMDRSDRKERLLSCVYKTLPVSEKHQHRPVRVRGQPGGRARPRHHDEGDEPRRTAAIPMQNPYCSCELMEGPAQSLWRIPTAAVS